MNVSLILYDLILLLRYSIFTLKGLETLFQSCEHPRAKRCYGTG